MLVFAVCGAALADNYRYERTAHDDAAAAAVALKPSDFPAQFALRGGPTKPDETPDHDSCYGYRPKESDLVVTGDAETKYANAKAGIVSIDSQVELLKTRAMTATDFARSLPMLSSRCMFTIAKQEHIHLVGSWLMLGAARCVCDQSASFSFETTTARKNLHLLWILTVMRRGRFESFVMTALAKSTADTRNATFRDALVVQGLAIKAVSERLAVARAA